jgi:bifunctional DNA-binding transcriptional regulator/antitoxin component of YhaV-PrlF toxin-antitoxin module
LAAKRRAERQIADEAHRFSGRTAETFEEELDKAVAQRRATKRVRSPTKPHQAVGGRSPPSKRQQVGGELEDEEEEEEEADRVAYATMRKAVGRLFDDWTGAAPLGSADRDALRAWVVSAVLEAETERWVGVSDGRGDYVDQFERVVAEGVPGLLDHDADPNAGRDRSEPEEEEEEEGELSGAPGSILAWLGLVRSLEADIDSAREREAALRNANELEPIFDPKTFAVVGVGVRADDEGEGDGSDEDDARPQGPIAFSIRYVRPEQAAEYHTAQQKPPPLAANMDADLAAANAQVMAQSAARRSAAVDLRRLQQAEATMRDKARSSRPDALAAYAEAAYQANTLRRALGALPDESVGDIAARVRATSLGADDDLVAVVASRPLSDDRRGRASKIPKDVRRFFDLKAEDRGDQDDDDDDDVVAAADQEEEAEVGNIPSRHMADESEESDDGGGDQDPIDEGMASYLAHTRGLERDLTMAETELASLRGARGPAQRTRRSDLAETIRRIRERIDAEAERAGDAAARAAADAGASAAQQQQNAARATERNAYAVMQHLNRLYQSNTRMATQDLPEDMRQAAQTAADVARDAAARLGREIATFQRQMTAVSRSRGTPMDMEPVASATARLGEAANEARQLIA